MLYYLLLYLLNALMARSRGVIVALKQYRLYYFRDEDPSPLIKKSVLSIYLAPSYRPLYS